MECLPFHSFQELLPRDQFSFLRHGHEVTHFPPPLILPSLIVFVALVSMLFFVLTELNRARYRGEKCDEIDLSKLVAAKANRIRNSQGTIDYPRSLFPHFISHLSSRSRADFESIYWLDTAIVRRTKGRLCFPIRSLVECFHRGQSNSTFAFRVIKVLTPCQQTTQGHRSDRSKRRAMRKKTEDHDGLSQFI